MDSDRCVVHFSSGASAEIPVSVKQAVSDITETRMAGGGWYHWLPDRADGVAVWVESVTHVTAAQSREMSMY